MRLMILGLLVSAVALTACASDGACEPVTCELACADGFARDADGCETCACAPAPDNTCAVPADCELAERPGCCSCPRGYASQEIDRDPCLVRAGEVTPAGCEPDPADCERVACAECVPATGVECNAGVCAAVE